MDILYVSLLVACGIAAQLKTCVSSPVTDPFKTEEFIRCKGMACEAWDEVQNILRDLRKGPYTDDNKFADDYASMPGTGSYVTNSDASNDTEGAVESDIWLTPEQAGILRDKLLKRQKRKLNFFSFLSKKWTMPIKYYIDGEFSDAQTTAIKGATHHFESQTCIAFRELTLQEALYEENQFLYFLKGESGCGTFIGQMHTILARPQVIQLENVCIEQWGAIVHEIGHTIGFWHEHQRTDRQQYVSIFPDRMKPGADQKQYDRGATRDLLPYDYGSVMHYWAWAFSQSFLNITIEPTDPLYMYTIGQKIGLSFLDAKLANLEYCSASCSSSTIECRNSGYQNPLRCDECKCPDGFEGNRCQRLSGPKKATCGGTIRLSSDGSGMSTYISSPGYDRNEMYEDHTQCTWLIEAPEGYKVSLRFMNQSRDHFGMYCRYAVCFHYVEVKFISSTDPSVTGPRFCCERLPGLGNVLPGTLTSEGRHMMVLMRSNFTVTSDQHLKMGFRAYVYATRDDNILPDPDVTIEPQAPPIDEMPVLLDVAFIMDSSGSVGLRNWNRIKEFTKNIIAQFRLGHEARFGFISFGSVGYLDMRFDDFDSVRLVHRKIDSLPWKRESSNIADGLRAARMELFSSAGGNTRSGHNLAILLTDGPASAEAENTQEQADRFKMEIGPLLVIGVGPIAATYEITSLASEPHDILWKYVEDFQQLGNLENDVANVIRDMGTHITDTRPPTTTTTTTTTTEPTTTSTTTTTTTTESTTTTTTTTPAPSQTSFEWSCDFESSEYSDASLGCDALTQERREDNFDWTRNSGRTPSEPTGPRGAASGRYYMFIEASRPRRNNDRARLYTAPVPRDGSYCLTFSYNMRGFHVNSLVVEVYGESSSPRSVWSERGEQGARWYTKTLTVSLQQQSKIAFTGVTGPEYSGDIAIDDLHLVSGSC